MKKLIILIGLFFLFRTPAHAAADFDTDFHSTYRIQPDNSTQVSHTIKITNKLAYVYLKKYTISLGSDKINHLVVTAEGKKAPTAVQTQGFATDLEITLTQPVIGLGQELNITITYDTPSVAVRYGDVLEINIPRLNKANEAISYSRQVIVPASYGEPRVTSPHPTTMTQGEGGDIILSYQGYPNSSITLLFGDKLSYELTLTYHISNPSPSTANTEIAIPPDTEYQRVLIDSLDPEPKTIRQDADDNWLAVYSLKGGGNATIKAKLYVTVYPLPTFASIGTDTHDLTRTVKYWETKSDNILSLVTKLNTPQTIYDYVVDTLTYDYDKVGTDSTRLGGSAAIDAPQSAICTEFTDTFVSLARAANIPSREINGVAYMGNSSLRATTTEDYLHAWPEYFDASRKTWIQVDPTLGKTTGGVDYFNKMDYGHITFVRHGLESTYPYPAGSYKSDPTEKTVELSLASTIPEERQTTAIADSSQGLTLTNTGNVALRDHVVTLPNGGTTTVAYLPPRATTELPRGEEQSKGIWNTIWTLLKKLLPLHS